MKSSKLLVALFFLSLSIAFSQSGANYVKEIDDWHSKREARLKTENGWLNLVGLYWLEQGTNTFGSGSNHKIKFPEGTIPSNAGTMELTGSEVKLVAQDGVEIKVNDSIVNEAIIFTNESDDAPVVAHANLRWTIIKRENKIGVRLRDLKSKNIEKFKGIDRYKVKENWRVEAELIVDSAQRTIPITNVLGQTSQQPVAGKLVFKLDDKEYSLDALDEDSELFIIFADETNSDDTYATGRFLYAKKPEEGTKVILDFNKAYNPPCAFTEFATCPLPPKQNILPIPIKAGEKRYEH